MPGAPDRIWAFFSSPANLGQLTPPDMDFRIVRPVEPVMEAGQMIEYRIAVAPGVRLRWLTEITHVRPGEYFVDEQRLGPYRLWHHEHRFAPAPGGLRMTDRVTYDVGWGLIGRLAEPLWIRGKLARIFDHRAERIAALFPARA